MISYDLKKKIRIFGLISFLLPLITINLCLGLFKILGTNDLYFPHNWDQKKYEYSIEQYQENTRFPEKKSFTNCPKYEYLKYIESGDGKKQYFLRDNYTLINNDKKFSITIEQNNTLNKKCIKKNYFTYIVLKKFPSLEKLLIKRKNEDMVGFGPVRNPYIYGEVSISRTARYFPATWIFKPMIILSALFLFIYWKTNLKIFNEIKKNTSKNFSKKFFYFGVISCIFLSIHTVFLGIVIDNEAYRVFRRIAITTFILFEVFAQIALTTNIYKFRKSILNEIYPIILNIKIIFVIIMALVTILSLIALSLEIVGDNFKHVLEWNYFSILLIYYFLNMMIWRVAKKT